MRPSGECEAHKGQVLKTASKTPLSQEKTMPVEPKRTCSNCSYYSSKNAFTGICTFGRVARTKQEVQELDAATAVAVAENEEDEKNSDCFVVPTHSCGNFSMCTDAA